MVSSCPSDSLTTGHIHHHLGVPRLRDVGDLVQRQPQSTRDCLLSPDLEMYPSLDITASSASNLPKAIITKAMPGVTVERVSAVAPAGLQRLYEVTLHDSRTMLLAVTPPEMLRLLRSEQSLTRSEGVLIRWLSDAVSSKQKSHLGEKQASKEPAGSPGGTPNKKQQPSNVGDSPPVTDEQSLVPDDGSLHSLLPPLVAQSAVPAAGTPYETPFTLFDRQQGTPVIFMNQALTQQQQNKIDFEAGRLARRLSNFTPGPARFGPAVSVLSPSTRSPIFGGFGVTTGLPAAGTWSLAFHTLLEAVLRDAEDMAVVLPYASVRMHFRRLGSALDEVVSPRLVVVNLKSRSNMLVTLAAQEATPPGHNKPETPTAAEDTASGSRGEVGLGKNDKDDTGTSALPTGPPSASSTGTTAAAEASAKRQMGDESTITLNGLRDWSHAVFGDPLFARAFTHEPTHHFLCGFGGRSQETMSSPGKQHKIRDLPEYAGHGAIRLLLYQCYHDIVDIVTTFYRPTKDSRTLEMAARRRLTAVLAELEKLEIPSSVRRHRRLSGEMSPSKRARTEDEDDGTERVDPGDRPVQGPRRPPLSISSHTEP